MSSESEFSVDLLPVQRTVTISIRDVHFSVDDTEGGGSGAKDETSFFSLCPSEKLLAWWEDFPEQRWDEFQRLYRRKLESQSSLCEQLRQHALAQRVILVYSRGTPSANAAIPLKQHLEELECRRRWQNGWMIGGHTAGVRSEIVSRGGIYYARHKAWMMPSDGDTRFIRSILPGNF